MNNPDSGAVTGKGLVINFAVVQNPLNTRDRVTGVRPWHPDAPVAEYVEGLPEEVVWAVGINAEVIPPERWASTYMKPNDFLTIVPVPQGGGTGKTVLRVIGMLAIAVAAFYTGGAALEAYGAVAGGAAGAGVMMAGSLSLNSSLGPTI